MTLQMIRPAPIPFGGLLAEGGARDHAPASLLGVMDATQSTYDDLSAAAPPVIRAAYDGANYNSWSESGVDCAGTVLDLGDLRPSREGFTADAARYQAAFEAELARGRIPFALGGDHAVTVPLVRAYGAVEERAGPIHVAHWDAHPDMHPDYDGNPDSHACVTARLLEMRHVASLTQIGIRTDTNLQRSIREAQGDRVTQIPAWEAPKRAGALLAHLPEGAPGLSHRGHGRLRSGVRPRRSSTRCQGDSRRGPAST